MSSSVHSQHSTFLRYYFHNNLQHSWPSDIIQSSDGGYVMVGSIYDMTVQVDNYYILKMDSMGDSLWHQENHSPIFNNSNVLFETSDSCFIFNTNKAQINLVKYSAAGNLIFDKSYHLPLNTFIFNSMIEINKKIYAFGTYSNAGKLNGFFGKFDLNGDTVMTILNTPFACGDNKNSIMVYGNDLIAMSGFAWDSVNGIYQSRLSIIDTSGNVIMERVFPTAQQTYGHIIDRSSDGNFYFSTLGSSDFFAKIDTSGNVIWLASIGVGVGKYNMLNIGPDTILVMGPDFGYQYLNDSGQVIINLNPFDLPFDYLPPHVVSLIARGNKIIMAGYTVSPFRSRSFIVEYAMDDLVDVLELETDYFRIYPNPVTISDKFLTVSLKLGEIKSIYIFDQLGKLVDELELTSSDIPFKIPIEKYVEGIYYLSAYNNYGQVSSARFIVTR